MGTARAIRLVVEFLVAVAALHAFLVRTPVAELGSRLASTLTGSRHRSTSLVSYFRTGGPGGPELKLDADPALLAEAAKGSRPQLLTAFVLASGGLRRSGAIELSPAGKSLLLARGANAAELQSPAGRLQALSRAMPSLVSELGSEEAALVGLAVGVEEARFAADRERASGEPIELESLLDHLPGSSRRFARKTAGATLSVATALELGWPVDTGARISSPFGFRDHPVLGTRKLHTGVDISVRSGTEVKATADGVVLRAGEDAVSGRYLVIDHGRGVTSAYGHNSELLVARGDQVRRGQLLALSGNTGRSTGPHLHYQIEIEREPVDPLLLARFGRASGGFIAAGD